MKKLLLSILVIASFNLYAQNVSQKDADIAVKRVLSYIYGKYLSDLEEKEEYQKKKKKVWYLGKGDCGSDIFAVEAIYGTGGNGVFRNLFLTSTTYVCNIFAEDEKILDLDEGVNSWKIEKQIKAPPNPEFLINIYDADKDDWIKLPTLKYQQKFRFNNKTSKFEAIGKKQFIGKVNREQKNNNTNQPTQDFKQENMKVAVDRVKGYLYAEYADNGKLEKGGELNKDVWYLGKDENLCVDECLDIFAIQAMYQGCPSSGCPEQALFVSSGLTTMYDKTEIKELLHCPTEKGVFSCRWLGEIKQTKKPPYPEFLITFLEQGDDEPCFTCASMKYQQKFRFNNKTLKFEPLGKRQFVGKKKY